MVINGYKSIWLKINNKKLFHIVSNTTQEHKFFCKEFTVPDSYDEINQKSSRQFFLSLGNTEEIEEANG